MTAGDSTDRGPRTLDDPLAEALRIVDAADAAGLQVRLLGGMAVRAHAPEWTARSRKREVDIDFATRSKDRPAFFALLEREGYTADRQHNALFGGAQGYFVDVPRKRPVDVLVDRMIMCHRIEWGDRLGASKPTLPLAELLLTKLQIIKINRKDVLDALVLIAEHPIAADDGVEDTRHGLGAISAPRITRLTSNDWGWWRTVTGNLDVLDRFLANDLGPDDLDLGTGRAVLFDPVAQVAKLREAIESAPKSARWGLRARIGDRVKWYEEPEEVGHAGLDRGGA
ncbi:MAG: nucleotidyltransferase family protein [Chloroflexi bacterium]|nr:nucleotidyltransferase family protein [Chloroflexota bacterium]